MSAIRRRCWLALVSAACALLALAGCKPPKMPTAGGLVSTSQPDESVPHPMLSAQPTGEPAIPAASHATFSSPPSDLSDPEPAALPPSGPAPTAPPQDTPPPSTPIVASPDLIPVDQANSGTGRPAGNPQAATARTQPPSPAAAGVSAIRLSAGVAVPLSLPTGTQMGMSVDYAIGGALNRSSKYVWVISSEGGGDIETEVKLAVKGTLQSVVPKLRPEDRPFNSRIEEVTPGGKRVRVSNVAPMQTSY